MHSFHSPAQTVFTHVQGQLFQALQPPPAAFPPAASPALDPCLSSATALLSSRSATSLPPSLAHPPWCSSRFPVSNSQLHCGWTLPLSAVGSGLPAHLAQLYFTQQQQQVAGANTNSNPISSTNHLIHTPQLQFFITTRSPTATGSPPAKLNLLCSQQQLCQQYMQYKHQTHQEQQQPQTAMLSPQLTTSPTEQRHVSTLLARHAARHQQWHTLQQQQQQRHHQLQQVLLPITPTSSTSSVFVTSDTTNPSAPASVHVQSTCVSSSGDVDMAVLVARLQAAEQQRDHAIAVVQQAANILNKHGSSAVATSTSTSAISPSSSLSSSSSSLSAFQSLSAYPLSSISSAPSVELSQLLSTILASQSATSSLPSPPASSSLLASALRITPVGSSIRTIDTRRAVSSTLHAPTNTIPGISKADKDNTKVADAHADNENDNRKKGDLHLSGGLNGKLGGRSERQDEKQDKRRSNRLTKHKRRRKSSNTSHSSSSSSTASSSTESSSPSFPSSSSSSSSSCMSHSAAGSLTVAAASASSSDGAADGAQLNGHSARVPSSEPSLPSSFSVSSLSPSSTCGSRQAPFDQLDGSGGVDEDEDENECSSAAFASPSTCPTSRSISTLLPSEKVLSCLSPHRKKRDRSCLPCPTLYHINKMPLRIVDVYIEQQYTLSKRASSLLSPAEAHQLVRAGVRFLSNAVGERELYVVAKDICLLLHTRKGNVAKCIGQFSGNEKCRMAVMCPRSDGTVSTHLLTVLSVGGVKRLLEASRSGVVDNIRQWYIDQLVVFEHPQAQLFAPQPPSDETTKTSPAAASSTAASCITRWAG